MHIEDLMLKRRSCRDFTDEEIDELDLNVILNCAMSGPSAHNRQPWEFFVVKNKEKLAALRTVTKHSNIEAPLAIVVCSDFKKTLSAEEFWVQDCAAAVENILLAATYLDYGSLWIGVHPLKKSVRKTKEILEVSTNITPVAIVLLGRPNKVSRPRSWYDESKIHFID